MHKLNIFTDGSCLNNPGPGGYGIIIKSKNINKELSSGYYLTTNNRMELIAVIKALEYIQNYSFININTDSMYVKLGITKWINSWKKKEWKTSKNKKIKNIDLWKHLYSLSKLHNLNWNWIKSHSGYLENERCDKLAKLAALNPTINDIGYI